MKQVTLEEFENCNKKDVAPEILRARELIMQFINLDEVDIVEITEGDFDNKFKFDESKQILRAATLLRSATNKLHESNNIAVKQRGNRLFVGKRDVLEPQNRWW